MCPRFICDASTGRLGTSKADLKCFTSLPLSCFVLLTSQTRKWETLSPSPNEKRRAGGNRQGSKSRYLGCPAAWWRSTKVLRDSGHAQPADTAFSRHGVLSAVLIRMFVLLPGNHPELQIHPSESIDRNPPLGLALG